MIMRNKSLFMMMCLS